MKRVKSSIFLQTITLVKTLGKLSTPALVAVLLHLALGFSLLSWAKTKKSPPSYFEAVSELRRNSILINIEDWKNLKKADKALEKPRSLTPPQKKRPLRSSSDSELTQQEPLESTSLKSSENSALDSAAGSNNHSLGGLPIPPYPLLSRRLREEGVVVMAKTTSNHFQILESSGFQHLDSSALNHFQTLEDSQKSKIPDRFEVEFKLKKTER